MTNPKDKPRERWTNENRINNCDCLHDEPTDKVYRPFQVIEKSAYDAIVADLNKSKSLLSEMLRLNTYAHCAETAASIALQKGAEKLIGIRYGYYSGEPLPLAAGDECICGEINARHCPVHHEDKP